MYYGSRTFCLNVIEVSKDKYSRIHKVYATEPIGIVASIVSLRE